MAVGGGVEGSPEDCGLVELLQDEACAVQHCWRGNGLPKERPSVGRVVWIRG